MRASGGYGRDVETGAAMKRTMSEGSLRGKAHESEGKEGSERERDRKRESSRSSRSFRKELLEASLAQEVARSAGSLS